MNFMALWQKEKKLELTRTNRTRSDYSLQIKGSVFSKTAAK
jgi:hypothetical protein